MLGEAGLLVGLEFGEVGVVVVMKEGDGGHLLRGGIARYDLPSASSGGHVRYGRGFHDLLAEGFAIQIIHAGYAMELPDGAIGGGKFPDACDETPICGGPEGDDFLLGWQAVGDEAAGGLDGAFVDVRSEADGGIALEPEWRTDGGSGSFCNECRCGRHGHGFFGEFLDGKQSLAEIVGGGLDDLGGIGDDGGVWQWLGKRGGA